MTTFQIVTISLCVILASLSLLSFFQKKNVFYLFYSLIWGLAVGFIYSPDFTTTIANCVGIGRGSDFVTYILLLFLLWCHFRQYVRYKSLEHKLTLLVRELAIAHPVSVPREGGREQEKE